VLATQHSGLTKQALQEAHVASPNLASSPSEIFNILLFFWLLFKVGVLTGLIMVPLALIGNEFWKLGRQKR
jgi:hypothetical protein